MAQPGNENRLTVLSLATMEAATYVKDKDGNIHMLVKLTTIPADEVEQVVKCATATEAEDLRRKAFGIDPTTGLDRKSVV